MKNLKIRNETFPDYRDVEELTREAFWNRHVPGCNEHYLLHMLRNCRAFIKELDFVAELDGKVVANIVYTKSEIRGDNGENYDVITFGPLSVLPDYQNQGIGGMLIRHTKEIAKKLGYRAILIYGDPGYYGRFDFVEAEKYGIRNSDNMYAAALQALELYPGALSDCPGCFIEDSVFEIDEKAAEEFDSSFPKKDKKNCLPSQQRFTQLANMKKAKKMELDEVIKKLESQYDPRNIEGMARFGINIINNYGCSIPFLKKLAKEIGKNHNLALQLWKTEIHDARLLAGFIDEPGHVTEEQMEEWANCFDSWDLCDQVCNYLFSYTFFAVEKAKKWIYSEKEFIKRAGFVLMAQLSVHEKKAGDKLFEDFLDLIYTKSADNRNYVKKAVNWALRQIGKRNLYLNVQALHTAERILQKGDKASRWIARDAVRELKNEKIISRLLA